jgi:multiple sugar transport system substrate-binding protein
MLSRDAHSGGATMRARAVALAVALVLVPLGARAADLVVWWEKGFYPQEDDAVREIIAAFEQKSGKQVELFQPAQDKVFDKAQAALAAGQPPDFLFAPRAWADQLAYQDRLVDLEGTLGPVLDLFDADAIDVSTLIDGKTGRRGLYAMPMGRLSNHVHVWNSLLERAGFTLTDIPREWEAFWSFWCDRVQPAVRKAMGRENIWSVGLPMSAGALDTEFELTQFQLAYQASWLSRDRRVQVDNPKVREGMVKAMSACTAIWRKGCTPPESATWSDSGNNKAFLAQTVVMTPNPSTSIPAALKRERPEDYQRNAATIDWPNAASGQPLVIIGYVMRAVVFKTGGNSALAEDFVRFLAEEGWLAHWLDFAGDRYMPPMRKLIEQPFWLNPSDPHRMRGAIQLLTRQHLLVMNVRDHEWQSGPIGGVWGNAVHRVVTEGMSPEQAVDEAIARIKQILNE